MVLIIPPLSSIIIEPQKSNVNFISSIFNITFLADKNRPEPADGSGLNDVIYTGLFNSYFDHIRFLS